MKGYIVLGAGLLFLLVARFLYFFSQLPVYFPGQKISITHTFFSEPKAQYGRQEFEASGIRVVVPLDPEFHYGDRILMRGRVEEKAITYKNQVIKRLYLYDPVVIPKPQSIPLHVLSGVRNTVVSTFIRTLGKTEAGLLLGIVLGVKEEIPQNFYAQLKKAGLLHIVAASGSNVSIVGGYLFALFGLLFSRKRASIVSCSGIILYALLSGLDPSIVRASLMGIFAYGALIFGRQYSGIAGLLFASYLMLLVSPLLYQDIGFLLSVAATASIIFIQPLFTYSPFFHSPFGEDIGVTIAAQIGTVPLLFLFFSTYPVFSFVSNLLVLWMIPFLMLCGGIAAALSFIPVLSVLFLWLSYPFLLFFEFITGVFSQISWSIELDNFPLFFVFSYYFFVLGFVLLWRKNHETKTSHP